MMHDRVTTMARSAELHHAADLDNPRKNRWTLERRPDVVAADVLAMMDFIGHGPLRTLASNELREWCAGQGWTPGYMKGIIAKVAEQIEAKTPAKADAVRAMMLHRMETLIPFCRSLVLGNGPSSKGSSAGTIAIRHPETGELLDEIDHTAIQGYLKIIAGLCGLSTDKHSVEHSAGESLTAAMLDAAEARAAGQAKPVEVVPPPVITAPAEPLGQEPAALDFDGL